MKAELIQQFRPKFLDQLIKVLNGPELGGQHPLQLMGVMLNELPEAEPAGLIFQQIFIHRLQDDIRDMVVKKIETFEARQLEDQPTTSTKWPHTIHIVTTSAEVGADENVSLEEEIPVLPSCQPKNFI